MARILHWDLICKVVDNFGDAGVALRLARILSQHYSQKVRIVIDRVDVLRILWPALEDTDQQQEVNGIKVRNWKDIDLLKPGNVVLEMFGCGLPASLIAKFAFSEEAPLWINLEHLSAEPWVQTHHLLKSPHAGDTESVYFYPGFNDKTGGLLYERHLLTKRADYQRRSSLRQITLGALGVHNPAPHSLVVMLFCYQHSELEGWMQSLAQQPIPVTLLLPPGPARESACDWLNAVLSPRSVMVRGSVTVCALPMVPQSSFDELLWCCDLAVVRGEDSFVRAQLAGVPFIWQAYPQSDGAHIKKVEAFLSLYLQGLPAEAAQALREVWMAWNQNLPLVDAWMNMLAYGDELHDHALQWMEGLAEKPSLARNLVKYAIGHVKSPTSPAP